MSEGPRASRRSRNGPSRNLTHELREELGQAIVGERFEGPFPTEFEISRQHGLSRSVTREAVKMLTAKGLLSARRRIGTVIEPRERWNLLDPDVLRWLLQRKFSLELLKHFSELRLAIEPIAARLAAVNATPDAIALIADGLDRMERAERGEGSALDADVEFHIAVLRAADNPFFVQFEELVRTALHSSIAFTNAYGGTANLKEHGDVLRAIERRLPDEADAAMRMLIDNVLALIRRASSTGFDAGRVERTLETE
jgi:DNA-binding FadR family transcriptional regulator